MQEYETSITEAFTRGLRPDPQVGRGFGRSYLHECVGVRPTPFGLRPHVDLTSNLNANWPWPQVTQDTLGNLLLYKDSIYDLDTLTPVRPIKFNDPGISVIPIGDVWHGTKNLHGTIATNNSCVIVRTEDSVSVSVREISSITDFRGRVLYAGCVDLWSEDWQAAMEEILLKSPIPIDLPDNAGGNYIFWSSIGGDSTWILRRVGEWLDLFERGDAGFAPMPWSVLGLLPLSTGVVTYGSGGLILLRPISEPMPTFSILPLAEIGILSRRSFAGDNNKHLFANTDGDIMQLTNELALNRIGKNVLDPDEDWLFTHNVIEDEFYISTQTESFVVTGNNISKGVVSPTVITNVAVASVKHINDDYIATTEILDFKYRDLKTVTTLELGYEGEGLRVAVDYRYNHDEVFTRSTWIPVNAQGFARIHITANEFRIAVKSDADEGFELDYINVKWQASGRRTTRGITRASETI